MHSLDVTSVLQAEGYWASYNRPYQSVVYESLGYAKLNDTYGAEFPFLFEQARPHSGYFRAQQYRREQVSIETVEDMQRVQGFNEWQTDPTSHDNSGFAIAARFDLSNDDPIPNLNFFYRGAWGAYDVKVTGAAWMLNDRSTEAGREDLMRVSVINGPTHETQEPFSWLDPEWAEYTSHEGLPDVYDFDFVQFAPGAAHEGPEPSPEQSCANVHCLSGHRCERQGRGNDERFVCVRSGLSPGQVAGVIIGVVLFILLIVLAGIYFKRQKAKQREWKHTHDVLLDTQKDAAAASRGYQSQGVY